MKMKPLLSLILALAVILSLAACGAPAEPTEPSVAELALEKSLRGNPLLDFAGEDGPVYGGDPSVLVVDDTVYLYVGHDTAPGESYVIPEYLCYTSTDLVDWAYQGVVLSMQDVTWADKNSAWAGQVARHYDANAGMDKYYFYFCSWDRTDSGKQSIGVAVSDSPTGPFVDLGQALVKGSFTTDETSDWNDIDPTVWIETDSSGEEHRYLAWGNSKLYMCELNEDMISVKDQNGDGKITFRTDIVSHRQPAGFTEGPWLYRRQDENGAYYGDYYVFYANGWRESLGYSTCSDLMKGNWLYGDVIMEPTATSNTNHPAVFDFQGETYLIYHNGSLPRGSGFRRVACIEKLHFYDDGSVAYVQETATGISGAASVLTAANGAVLAHEKFNNAAADDFYPYINVGLGSGLARTDENDTLWELVSGKADKENPAYVSIESYNKPGLYITCGQGAVGLSQDHDGQMAQAQTFRTLAGEDGGVRFESVAFPGMYLTLSGGKASLTDGTDAAATTFHITGR